MFFLLMLLIPLCLLALTLAWHFWRSKETKGALLFSTLALLFAGGAIVIGLAALFAWRVLADL